MSNNNFVNEIEQVQYNAGLDITAAIRGTSKERLFNELGFEFLDKRRWFHRLCLFWKIVNGYCPKYLSDELPPLLASRNPLRQFTNQKQHTFLF